jgi:hypothetical protein
METAEIAHRGERELNAEGIVKTLHLHLFSANIILCTENSAGFSKNCTENSASLVYHSDNLWGK